MTGCTGSCINGRCINGTCVCNAGWSGNQDLWTQDLGRWGGPNISCPTPVYFLQVAWAIYLVLAALLWLVLPVGIRQQWRKFQDLKNAGKVQYWFQHFPLGFLLFIFFLMLPCIMACSSVKLATKDLSEVVGATTAATVVFVVQHTLGPTSFGIFMLQALKTFAFSGLDDAASAPALKAFIHSVSWLFVVAAATIALASLYPVVSASKSPFEYQDLHKLCAQLYLIQMFIGQILLSLTTALMGGRVIVAMNGIISNRLELASRTNQSDILASVANLRRTRLKVVLVFANCSLAVLFNAGLLLTMELDDDWLVFIGIPYDTQPMITISLAYFSVLSYTTVPTLPFKSLVRSSPASASAAAGEQSGSIEVVDLEQPEEAPPEANEPSFELEPEQVREPDPEQASELEPEQARELEPEQVREPEPEQASELERQQARELEPEQAREPEPVQARELEPEQARELEPEQARELEPGGVREQHVGRAEGWDIGGPAHLAC